MSTSVISERAELSCDIGCGWKRKGESLLACFFCLWLCLEALDIGGAAISSWGWLPLPWGLFAATCCCSVQEQGIHEGVALSADVQVLVCFL